MKKRVVIAHILMIVILCVAVYNNARRGAFILDDYTLVKDNIYIKSYRSVPRFFTKSLSASAFESHRTYRPLTMATFVLDHYFWKLDPQGYHLTNILIHAATALCLYWFATLLFGNVLLALWMSLFFVVLPVHTEVVTYISGRSEALALLFMLLSFVFYLKQKEEKGRLFSLLSILSFVFAVLSKENSFILPVLLCLYHISFKKKVRPFAFFGMWGLVGLAVLSRAFLFKSAQLKANAFSTVFERLPGFFVAFANYLRLLVWPFDLHMGYGRRLFLLTEPRVWLGILLFTVIAVYALKKKKAEPTIFFAISWFYLSLLPVSNLYPLPYYMAEHWLYVPSVGFCLLLALAARRQNVIKVLLGGLMAFYCIITINQNEYWRDPVSFYTKTLKFNPASAVMHTDLGIAHEEAGRKKEAMAAYRKAIEVQPDYAKAYNNIGLLYYNQGIRDEAKTWYQKAIQINPAYFAPYSNLAVIYAEAGQADLAIDLYKLALRLEPNYAKASYNLGNVYFDLGRYEEAAQAYKKALVLNPGYAKASGNLAICYFYGGDYELAIEYADRAAQANAANPDLLEALKPYRRH